MINLFKQILNIIPFSTWIALKNEIIYVNNKFENVFQVELSNIKITEKEIKLIENDKEILIIKENDSNFIFNGKRYIHKVVNDVINNELIEIGMLLEEEYLNDSLLENQSEILRTVIDNVPELIFYKDKDGVYRGANKQCIDFYSSRGVNEFIGKTDLQLPLNKEFIENCANHDSIVIKTKKPLVIDEECVNSSGTVDVFETIKTPVLNSDNEVIGLVGVVRDITSRKTEERKLRYLSYTDVLTGLYNRAFFDEKIQDLIKSNSFPIGIIMGDINGLKLVNDTFGHIEGDKLIIKIANAIKAVCENNKLIFRWGGDEFIILIPNSSEKKCEDIINRINTKLGKSKEDSLILSMSMGYSMIKNKSMNVDNALKEAENKLYKQKILIGESIRSSILTSLIKSLESKNVETFEHTERVHNYCMKIGEILNLKEDIINELTIVAKLHDIGKISIPENILLKPAKLTSEEYEVIKTHAESGYRLAMTIPELSHIAKGILTHHERWDGSGYPLGIKGEEIPLVARIVSVVDAYDAMTNRRGYNNVKSKEEAIKELRKCSGHQFDPNITEIFCNILEKEE